MRLPLPLFALSALAWVGVADAATRHTITLDRAAPVEVGVESFCDQKPASGFMPIRVTLRNLSDRDQRYTLAYAPYYNASGEKGAFVFTVPAGGRTANIVYAPVVPAANTTTTAFTLTGPGVRNGQFQLHGGNGYGGTAVGCTGLGEAFSASMLGMIEAELKPVGSSSSSSVKLNGTKISPDFAPADRRAYDGFASMWFEENEWATFEPGARDAIRAWVALGGQLHLVGDVGEEAVSRVGFGAVNRLVRPTSGKVFATRVVATLRACEAPVEAMAKGQPKLFSASDFGAQERPMALILAIVAFALVVGPVNFFVFAKSPHRHRLIWTTPLISSVAALLLFAFILMADGVGARGHRYALAVLVPEDKRLALWQQQVSKSGLLLGTDFAFDRDASLAPIRTGIVRNDASYSKSGDTWGGDWFASREVAAQAIARTVTARGGVRVTFPTAGVPGVMVSSLETPLAECLVVAPDGETVYVARDLVPGVSRPLVAVDKAEGTWAWQLKLTKAGEIQETMARALLNRPGYFYATSAKPATVLVPTLDTIRWEDDVALIAGPVETTTK